MHKQKLIQKFLNKTISQEERKLLEDWILESEGNMVFFKNLIKESDKKISIDFDSDTAYQKFNLTIDSKKPKARIPYTIFKYAAVAVLFLGIAYFYHQSFLTSDLKNTTTPNEESITLELENGSMEIISEGVITQIVNTDGKVIGQQNGNRLIYNKTEGDSDELVYNQLTVPYGKRFELELSDGTTAYLNAGSSLKYPVKFLKGESRQVYLTGEAFLDVAKNVDQPFIINTGELNIRVLGTQFNVSTYPEDETSEVVLVEGSVGLYSGNEDYQVEQSTVLKPGFKGSFNKKNGEMTTKPVITSIYTSWMNGELVFRNMTFGNILKKLERHYNVIIINKNIMLSDKVFNANFGKEPIQNVLEELKNNYGIRYEISDANKIIIE